MGGWEAEADGWAGGRSRQVGRRLQPIDLQKAKTPSVLQARILELRGVCTLQDALRGGNVPNVPEEAILKRLPTYVQYVREYVRMHARTRYVRTYVFTYVRTYVRT